MQSVDVKFNDDGLEGELRAVQNPQGFAAEARMKSEHFRAWVDMVVDAFTESNGINYVTFTGNKPGFGEFEVTIQKANGKTPAQALVEKQLQVDEMHLYKRIVELLFEAANVTDITLSRDSGGWSMITLAGDEHAHIGSWSGGEESPFERSALELQKELQFLKDTNHG